jgi:hypothetical protein
MSPRPSRARISMRPAFPRTGAPQAEARPRLEQQTFLEQPMNAFFAIHRLGDVEINRE